jgi:hypothetical protein
MEICTGLVAIGGDIIADGKSRIHTNCALKVEVGLLELTIIGFYNIPDFADLLLHLIHDPPISQLT